MSFYDEYKKEVLGGVLVEHLGLVFIQDLERLKVEHLGLVFIQDLERLKD